MRPIEEYLQNADKLAQEVMNAWGINVAAGNPELLSEAFKAALRQDICLQ